MSKQSFVIKGNICYSVDKEHIQTIESGYVVCEEGVSKGVFETLPDKYAALPVEDYGDQLIIPGLVDLHIHAPQFAYRGLGMDLELLDWLQTYAFPEETKYRDLEYAKKAYGLFVDKMKKSATTHACVFATRHREATELLMEMMEEAGLESFIGKVNMDREAPDHLREANAAEAKEETIQWIENVLNKYEYTKPILTPRFIPSCTDELMSNLHEIQKTYDLPIQSHLSENLGEIAWVSELRPSSRFYGDAYDQDGLFGKEYGTGKAVPTIMAHCVYSSDEEIQLMLDNDVFVVHCPASNTNVSSGIAPIRKYLDANLKMGIGSDVAGGHTESLFRAITDTIQMSKMYWRLIDQNCKQLTFDEAFYLATKGGGEFFGKVGSFEDGYQFNAVVLDDSIIPHPQELNIHQRLERAAYLSLDLLGITSKYAHGKKLF